MEVGTVGGAHGVTNFFIDLIWFYYKTINTALFDLNKSSSNWLKNKFKKEMFDVYTELEKNCSYWDQLLFFIKKPTTLVRLCCLMSANVVKS